MLKVTLFLLAVLFLNNFQKPGAIKSDEACLAKADVEKILGLPVFQTESKTSNENNILMYWCSWKSTQEDLNSNLYYIEEEYKNAESADKVFDDIVVSNRNNPGQSTPDIGDEAWFHSDGTNFVLLMVRKGNKMIRMKVNKLTKDTSVPEMERIAIEWQRKG